MAARHASLLVVVFAVVASSPTGCSNTKGKYAPQLQSLQSADVGADVAAAVFRGDFRFVGVMGYALAVPAVPDYHEKYAARHDVRVIENTSDAIESPEHEQLQQVARDYAERYNKLLLSRLPQP